MSVTPRADVREELVEELAVPALLVAVEDEALGEVGIPGADFLGELERAGLPGFLGAVGRVEELDAGAALFLGLENDGLREVEVLVVHPLGALAERLEPPGRGALRGNADERGDGTCPVAFTATNDAERSGRASNDRREVGRPRVSAVRRGGGRSGLRGRERDGPRRGSLRQKKRARAG